MQICSYSIRYCNRSIQEGYNEFIAKIILFIICPFLSFLYSLRKPASNSSLLIFFFYGLLYAWVMNANYESDFSRIVDEFYSQSFTFSEVWKEFTNLLNGTSKEKEIYRIFLFALTREFTTNNYHLLFFLASIPYMYFMIKSIKCITSDKKNYSNNFYFLVLIALFILPYNFFWISNFKFSTGVWISIFALIKILIDKEKKYLILIFITPLIHSGFWFLLLIISLFFLIRKRTQLLVYLFYISIPFAFIETNLISILDFSKYTFLPDSISTWGNNYLTDSEMLNKFGMYRKDGSGFYYVELFLGKLSVLSYISGLIIIISKGFIKHKISDITDFYTFVILIFTITNFIQIIPTLGNRYLSISEILFTFLWFKVFSNNPKRKYLYFILIALTYNIIFFNLKFIFSMVEYDFFYSNLFSLIAKSLNTTSYNIYLF